MTVSAACCTTAEGATTAATECALLPKQLQIRRAGTSDVAALASLYVEAFESNPAYVCVFKQQQQHSQTLLQEALHWLFQRRVAVLLANACPFYCIETRPEAAGLHQQKQKQQHQQQKGVLKAGPGEQGSVVAAVGIMPFSHKPSVWSMIWHGLWQVSGTSR